MEGNETNSSLGAGEASRTDLASIHCSTGALMGAFGLFVQALLALVAFSSLIVKRFMEPKDKRRSWKIWFFDTSKQGIGAVFIHFVNVLLSEVFDGDPCTTYIISFLLDSTLGLLIIWGLLKLGLVLIVKKGWSSLVYGEYGTPARLKRWLGQCGVYLLVMVGEKALITAVLQLPFWDKVREVIMSPIKNPKLELAIVMFIVPVIVNALMFWVVDNFLMKTLRVPSSPSSSSTSSGTGELQVKYRRGNVVEDSDCEMLGAGPVTFDPVVTSDSELLIESAAT